MIKTRSGKMLAAVATSFISKGTTLLLQLVSMPLVARTLGVELYGVYLLLAIVPSFFSCVDAGVGPALARKISTANAKSDSVQEAVYFSSAMGLLAAMSAIVFVVVLSLYLGGGYIRIIGSSALDHAPIFATGFPLIGIIVCLQLFVNLGTKTRAAYQEVHINNIFGAVSNIGLAAGLVVVAKSKPDVVLFILVAFGIPAVIQTFNLLHVILHRRYLVQAWRNFNLPISLELVRDGILYSITVGCLSWEREMVKIALAQSGGATFVAKFGALNALLGYGHGVTIMITAALWPAILNGLATNDAPWLAKAWRMTHLFSLLYAVVGFMGVFFLGNYVMILVFGAVYATTTSESLVLGAYFAMMCLSAARFIWLLATARSRFLVSFALAEFILVLGTSLVFGLADSVYHAFLVLALAHCVGSVIPYFFALRGLREKFSLAHSPTPS